LLVRGGRSFYLEAWWGKHTSKLEDHPLLAVYDCLFKIFTAVLHICGMFYSSAAWRFIVVVTGDQLNSGMAWNPIETARKLNNIFIFQSPDGKYIASGAIDGIINIFDVSSGKLVHTLEGKIYRFVTMVY
jgi:WD40 repeat protein